MIRQNTRFRCPECGAKGVALNVKPYPLCHVCGYGVRMIIDQKPRGRKSTKNFPSEKICMMTTRIPGGLLNKFNQICEKKNISSNSMSLRLLERFVLENGKLLEEETGNTTVSANS